MGSVVSNIHEKVGVANFEWSISFMTYVLLNPESDFGGDMLDLVEDALLSPLSVPSFLMLLVSASSKTTLNEVHSYLKRL